MRPHVPLVAPESYYDPYPQEGMQLAPSVAGDWDDIPEAGIAHYNSVRRGLEDPGRKRKVRSAYYASVVFMDEQVAESAWTHRSSSRPW